MKSRNKPSAELRGLKERCGVFNPIFLYLDLPEGTPALTPEQTKAVSDAFQVRFNSWWDSWVEPELKYLAQRGK